MKCIFLLLSYIFGMSFIIEGRCGVADINKSVQPKSAVYETFYDYLNKVKADPPRSCSVV